MHADLVRGVFMTSQQLRAGFFATYDRCPDLNTYRTLFAFPSCSKVVRFIKLSLRFTTQIELF
jgi:hypothetical protein